MNTGLLIAIIVVAVVVFALAWLVLRRRHSARLRDQFGPEYDRAVSDAGSRQAGEHQLDDRRARRRKLEIVPLATGARDRYLQEWRMVQARFVDSPPEATRGADRLINEVMRARGYPVEDFDQRAADISVDHPQVVDDYRAAHAVAEANERSQATTEDLRQALVHYRSLFEDLLEADQPDGTVTWNGAVPGAEPMPREEPVTGGQAATNDWRPSEASTPPQRRSTEEAR